MNVLAMVLAGLAATTVMTVAMSGSQILGWTRMSMPYLLGTALSGDRDRAMAIGTLLHFLNGWMAGVLHALFLEHIHRANWWIGGGLGAIHGLLVFMVVLPMLPGLHPRMASEHEGPAAGRQLEPPGPMGLNYGWRTPIVGILAHVAYGVVFGAMYRLT